MFNFKMDSFNTQSFIFPEKKVKFYLECKNSFCTPYRLLVSINLPMQPLAINNRKSKSIYE